MVHSRAPDHELLTMNHQPNKMKILVFDNYDSFSYNLVHLVEKITGEKVDVYRNDQIALADVVAYDKIILSPGPGIPEEAGLLLPLIKEYAATKSILGVCLGHQAIVRFFMVWLHQYKSKLIPPGAGQKYCRAYRRQ